MVRNRWVFKGLIRHFLRKLDELHLITHIEGRIDVRFPVIIILSVEVDGSKGLNEGLLVANLFVLYGVEVYYSTVCGINDHHYCLVQAAPLDNH